MARLTFTHVARHFHTLGASAAHHFTHAARERTNGRRIGADARPAGALQVTRSPTFRSRRLPTPIRLVVSAAFDPDRVGLVAGRATPRDDVLPCARRPFGGRRPDPDGERRNTSVRPMPRTPMAKRGRPRPATRASPVPPPFRPAPRRSTTAGHVSRTARIVAAGPAARDGQRNPSSRSSRQAESTGTARARHPGSAQAALPFPSSACISPWRCRRRRPRENRRCPAPGAPGNG